MGTMRDVAANRPTDLGPSDLLTPPDDTHPSVDTGFQFFAEDTLRMYVWDGTAWINISRYGTHAERLAQPVDAMPDGAMWVETDRGNVLYQLQNGVWWYIAGTMFGTLSPDQRPADLGVPDAGFDFRTSVPPQRQFIWSQTAWVEVATQTPWPQGGDARGAKL